MDATPLTVLTNLFETLQEFLSWSEDVHLVLGLSSRYFFFYQLFPLFRQFFPGSITIGIDTLWAQLLLEFSTDHFETMRTYSTSHVNVHEVLGLSFLYFLSTFSAFST